MRLNNIETRQLINNTYSHKIEDIKPNGKVKFYINGKKVSYRKYKKQETILLRSTKWSI